MQAGQSAEAADPEKGFARSRRSRQGRVRLEAGRSDVMRRNGSAEPGLPGPDHPSSLDGGAPVARRNGATTADTIVDRLKALEQMDSTALRVEWRRLYRSPAPKRVARNLLMLGVAWKIQERAYGGLGAATKRRLAELAKTLERNGDVTRNRVALLKPGAKLVREWHGETHTVTIVEDGFEWNGRQWRSLSAIAKLITGVHWSGPRFFGLNGKAGQKTDTRAKEVADA